MNDGTTTIIPNDAGQDRSPADIRAVFSQNLKELMGPAPNVSALCRKLSLNRTQFNRYLAGESFPPYAWDVVQFAAQSSGAPALPVVCQRESVGFVAHALNEFQ